MIQKNAEFLDLSLVVKLPHTERETEREREMRR